MAGLNASLGDGTVTISTIARDWFGNQGIKPQQLDTQHHNSDIHLRTQLQHRHGQGRKLPLTNRSIHRPPPTGGSFTTTTQHSTLGQIGSHPTPETTQESWGWPGSSSSLTSGQIWINVQQQTPSIERPWTPTPTSSMAKSINTNTVHHRLEHNQQCHTLRTKLTTTTGQPSRCGGVGPE